MSELHAYIAQGEHLTQDFKFRIDDQKKIARTLCAFANTNGGRLLIGVKDNGKITGIDPQEEFHMIEGASELFCKPPVPFKSKIWQEDFKLVLEIIIEKSEQAPHRAYDENGKLKAYVRLDDQTLAAGKILEKVWRQKSNPISVPEKFDEEELNFIRLIGQLQPVSISKLYRTSGLSLKQVDRLLVLMICWDIVEMVYTKEGVLFRLVVDNLKS